MVEPMKNEIIDYREMCNREGVQTLQRGMNFELGNGYSVILMSISPNAPYQDRIEDDGSTLIYEGHDVSKKKGVGNPKLINQPEFNVSGSLTQNGKFNKAAIDYKSGIRKPAIVKVYEKIRSGIWSYNGLFELIDSWVEDDSNRKVFKFKLIAIEADNIPSNEYATDLPRRRIIPTEIKVEVWKRDKGKCVVCGAKDELHFDHILPFSKGGTSIEAENVQLLCARHNLEKRDKIQ